MFPNSMFFNSMTSSLMVANAISRKHNVVFACLLALLVNACSQPAPESAKDVTPAQSAAQPNSSVATTETDAASAAVRILNAAHKNGAVILRGQCSISSTNSSN